MQAAFVKRISAGCRRVEVLAVTLGVSEEMMANRLRTLDSGLLSPG
jgi:hypothetical protein